MTEESRITPVPAGQGAADEARLDRALDRLLAGAPAPELPGDLAQRILAATHRIPQVPADAPRSRPSLRRPVWFGRPRAIAAAFALVAAVGFAAGWVEPMLIGDAQAIDVSPFVYGIDPEIDL